MKPNCYMNGKIFRIFESRIIYGLVICRLIVYIGVTEIKIDYGKIFHSRLVEERIYRFLLTGLMGGKINERRF